jgi:6-phosphogluconolactonase
MAQTNDLRIVADAASLFHAAAQDFANQVESTLKSSDRFTVALSGGSTPKGLFSLLASSYRERLPWNKIFFFWGDERHVPPDSSESNYRMANEALLSKVPIPPANIFRVPAENSDASRAAEEYEKTLRNFFHPPSGTFPQFDLILLGMGPDGHCASLFPGTAALQEKSKFVVANWVDKFKTFRITFTGPLINQARVVEFLVAGADKSASLYEVLEGSGSANQFPSKMIHPVSGQLIWLVDKAAAASLSRKSA